MAHIAIVGGGVSGMSSALVLSRAGHRVTVIERDDTPTPESAVEAFKWNRKGAPQVRHSHAFLARLVTTLRDKYPDVLERLIAEGATPMRFGDDMPPEITNYTPEDGDEDLMMLACRRTTYEWVLRTIVTDEGNVTIDTGRGVTGFTIDTASSTAAVPVVDGLRFDDGSTLSADLVIAAGGRRSVVPEWLAELGIAPIHEEVEDTGIVYYSRWYELRDGHEYPPRTGPIGGDLGYLKYGVFVGDNRTFSITLATPVADEELRRTLSDPVVFDTCARQLVATAPWLDGRATPMMDDVAVMAGLLNRWREYTVDGEPVVLGMLAVGDALLCTNPLYGRGCSTAFWSADLLGRSLGGIRSFDRTRGTAGAADTTDTTDRTHVLKALAQAYDAAIRSEILPWYKSTVAQDAEARRVATALLEGTDPDADDTDPRTFIRAVLRDGLVPAMRTDAVVLRAFFRNFNLLNSPEAIMNDPDVSGRIFAAWQDRDNRPPEPKLGPATRAELVSSLVG